MVKLYKSCSAFDNETNKIEIVFFYNFLCILHDSAKTQELFKNKFTQGSLEVSADS
jgi:hypothetical protein